MADLMVMGFRMPHFIERLKKIMTVIEETEKLHQQLMANDQDHLYQKED